MTTTLKTLLPLLCLAVWMPVLAPAEDKGEAKAPAKKEGQKLAADLKVCPEGHKALRDVPILHGFAHRPLFRVAPEKLEPEERKLYDRMKRGEVIVVPEPARKNAAELGTICTECLFRFMTPVDPDGEAMPLHWRKQADDMAGFKLPFSETFKSFPRVAPLKDHQEFTQIIREDGKSLGQEVMVYGTRAKPAEVVAKLGGWLAAQKIDPETVVKTSEEPDESYQYRGRTMQFTVERARDNDGDWATSVAFSVRHLKEEEGAGKK
jgi:hypothetical protein